MRSLFAFALALSLATPVLAQTTAPAPAPASAAQSADGRHFVVFFPEWSAAIDAPASAVIAAAAAVARANPNDPVFVTGFADPVGSARANALVSSLRAQEVTDALVALGIPDQRIETRGAGGADYVLTPQESRLVKISVGAK